METILTLQGLMEQNGNCDTAGPYGIMETIVTLQGLREARGHCDTLGPCATKGQLWYHGNCDNYGTMEPRRAWNRMHGTKDSWNSAGHLEPRGHCDTAEPKETFVTLSAPMDTKVQFDIAGPHGILTTVKFQGPVESRGPSGPH